MHEALREDQATAMQDEADAVNYKLDQLIRSLNIDYKPKFTPASKVPPRGDNWECATWQVTLTRGPVSLATPYYMGLACLPGLPSGGRVLAVKNNVANSLEKGTYPVNWFNDSPFIRRKPLTAPKLRDVLYSLVQDASVIDHDSFESWASEFGYDEDSRAAERTYQQCMAIALKLRAMLGEAALSALREAFQDY